MDKNDLNVKHVLPVFVILAMFVLMSVRGEAVPPGADLYAPTPAPLPNPPCDCEHDDLDCRDFTTHTEAQACFDYCWIQVGRDFHHLDSDGDGMACEPTPVPELRRR